MVKRELYMNKLKTFIDKDTIKVISGIRRSGKSYFIKLIIDELIKSGVKEENILLIDLEIPPYNYIETRKELDDIVLNFLENKKERVYLFFDEIQNVNEWEKSINGYYKLENTDVYITGSNSKLLSKEFSTLLTGRYTNIRLYPFSFNEFLDYKKELNDGPTVSLEENTELENYFQEYFQYGGSPFTISSRLNKLTTLNDLYSSIIYNDIVQRFQIRNMGVFKRIVKYIIEKVGNEISVNSLYNELKNTDRITKNTIYNYLDYLEEAYFIKGINNEKLVGKKEITGSKKYYLMDHGFYKSELEQKQQNLGKILENIVFVHLLRNDYVITVGKVNEYEVDFIAKKENKKLYFQVTYQLSSEDIINREFRPLLLIRDNYPKYVLSMDKFDFSREGIIHMNIINFLKNFEL